MGKNYNLSCARQNESELKKTDAIKTLAYLIKKYSDELSKGNNKTN